LLFLAFRWGGGLGTTCTIHLRLIGKRVTDFPFGLIEFLLLGVTAERILIGNQRFWRGWVSFGQIFT